MRTIQLPHPTEFSVARTHPQWAKPLAATIIGLGLLVAGCGSSSPDTSMIGSPASFSAAAFKYSSCMRDHGLSSFPDPTMTRWSASRLLVSHDPG